MRIFDVSNIIYGGHLGRDYRVKGFPIGGIRKMIGLINEANGRDDMVFAFDSGRIAKKELLPTYKAGRVPDYSVWAQLDYLREVFDDCGIPYYQFDGYEADDVITSVCALLEDCKYGETTYVYSDDRDMACCVSDTISIKNVTSQGITINRQNYSERVVKGISVPYNTLLCHKIVHGDHSDAYGALKVNGLSFEMLAEAYVTQASPLIEQGQLSNSAYYNYDAFIAMLDDFRHQFTAEEFGTIEKRARIVFPYRVPVVADMKQFMQDYLADPAQFHAIHKHLKVLTMDNINQRMLNTYCTAFNLNKIHRDRAVMDGDENLQRIYDRLGILAKDLSSGALAAERYASAQHVIGTSALDNLDIPV